VSYFFNFGIEATSAAVIDGFEEVRAAVVPLIVLKPLAEPE